MTAATNKQIAVVTGYDPDICPLAIALTPDGRTAYVAGKGYNNPDSVPIIDTRTNNQIGSVKNYTGGYPSAVVVSPNGEVVYVANSLYGDAHPKSISVIDVATNTQIDTIDLPSYDGVISSMALSPHGETAYVSFMSVDYDGRLPDPGIVVVDVATKQTSFIPPSTQGAYNGARIIAVSPNGNKAYATNPSAYTVSVIDTRSNKETGLLKKWNGSSSGGLAFSPDGKTAYITTDESVSPGEVLIVDTATDTVIGTVSNGQAGYYIGGLLCVTFTSDGRTAYILGQYSEGFGNAINVATNTITDTLHGYDASQFFPWSYGATALMAVTPDSARLYIASPNRVSVIDVLALPSTIATVLPSTGSVTGGTPVTIKGANLSGTTEVDFGGVAGHLLGVSDSEVMVTTPSHAVGSADVTVKNPGGNATAAGAYTYITDTVPSDVLTITDPFQGTTVTIPYTIAGTGNAGATVTVHGAASDPIDAPVEPDGTWSTKVEAGAFDGAVSITAKQSTGGEARRSYSSVYAAGFTPLTIMTPTDHQWFPSNTESIAATGRGQTGAQLNVVVPGATTCPEQTLWDAGTDGYQWFCGIQGLKAGYEYVLTATQSKDGATAKPATVTFGIVSPIVVENPPANAVLPAGTTEVTMSGTGQPGAKIVISTLSSAGIGLPECTTTVASEGANKGQWSCDIKSLSTGLKYLSTVIQSGQGWTDPPVPRRYSVGTAEAE